MADYQFDIAKSAKVLDDLKADLVNAVGTLLKTILRGSQMAIIESLANIIIISYLIGKRLGINFYEIDKSVFRQLNKSVKTNNEIECWFKDISSLKKYKEDIK